MNLTNEQVEIMAVCAMCQADLEAEQVKPALESGMSPSRMFCGKCTGDPASYMDAVAWLAADRAAQLLQSRAERAGLTEQYERLAVESQMKANNEQN